MGLIVISDLFCFDVVVCCMSTNEPDINNLKFVLHGYDRGARLYFSHFSPDLDTNFISLWI